VRQKSKKEVKEAEKEVKEPKKPAEPDTVRYYIDEAQSTEDNVPKRKKLQTLPSYIPL
jgi:hypothetical protein